VLINSAYAEDQINDTAITVINYLESLTATVNRISSQDTEQKTSTTVSPRNQPISIITSTLVQPTQEEDDDNVGKVVDCSKDIVSLIQGMNLSDAQSKLKQLATKVQFLQQLCENITYTMDASQRITVTNACIAVQQQALEYIRVVRVTLDFNEPNYVETLKNFKHDLTTLVKLLIYAPAPTVEPVKHVPEPETASYDNPFNTIVKEIVSKNKTVTEMLQHDDFDDNAFLSIIKSIVNSAKKSLEYTTDDNLQNTLVDSVKILLQNSIAFKSTRTLETKTNLLASLTSLVHSLLSAGTV